MAQLQFKLEVFEGPLDLLLHLIKKHKLNICDIEISTLLEQYLNYINEMQAQNLEVASEFLEMAAQLVYIKTCSLLPKSEEEEKLKAELTGKLLQLDLVKNVAKKLQEQCRYGKIFARNQMKISVCNEYTLRHDPSSLSDAYLVSMTRAQRKLPPPKSAFSGIVEHRVVSITSRVIFVLRKLYKTGQAGYNDFFVGDDRSEKVATFLAILELAKSKRIQITDDNQDIIFMDKSRLKSV